MTDLNPIYHRVTVSQETPLQEAVEELNQLARLHKVGKEQSPVTVNEVVAAIQRKLNSGTKRAESRLREIIKAKSLSAGESLRLTSGLSDQTHFFQVWWVDLAVDNGGVRIRDRTLSVRPLTTAELASRERLRPMIEDGLRKDRDQTQPE